MANEPKTPKSVTNSSIIVLNPFSHSSTLISIDVAAQAPIKLTTSNYMSWKIQFTTLLVGYDILGYIDWSLPCPQPIIKENGKDQINPAYSLWIRQDRLILSAIIASLTESMVPFIRWCETAKSAWTNSKLLMGNHQEVVSWLSKLNL